MPDQIIDGNLKVTGTLEIEKGINITSLIANNVRIDGAEFDENWIPVGSADDDAPSWYGSWTNYASGTNDWPPSRVRKDASGNVFVELYVKDGNTDQVITISEKYRPDNDQRFMGYGKNRIALPIIFKKTGEVIIDAESFDNDFISLTCYYNVGDGFPVQGPQGFPGTMPWESTTTYPKFCTCFTKPCNIPING
jgi:hypothetical protein